MDALRLFPMRERDLDQLMMEGRFSEAAALCPTVLQGSPSLWNWWIHNFIRLGQLPALLPHIPTSSPQLKTSTYDAVLQSLISHAASNALVLPTAQKWGASHPRLFSLGLLVAHLQQQREDALEAAQRRAQGANAPGQPGPGGAPTQGEAQGQGQGQGQGRQEEGARVGENGQGGDLGHDEEGEAQIGSLEEAMAYAYTLDSQLGSALQVYLHPQPVPHVTGKLACPRSPWPPVDVFDFIREHNLSSVVHREVLTLMSIDPRKASSLLVSLTPGIPPEHVLAQIGVPPGHTEGRSAGHTAGHAAGDAAGHAAGHAAGQRGTRHSSNGHGGTEHGSAAHRNGDVAHPPGATGKAGAPGSGGGMGMGSARTRAFLHHYLHALFETHPELSAPYQHLQVPLYAEFDRPSLMSFLRRAEHYRLQEALAECSRRRFWEEQAFLLGRMGDFRGAMAVTLEEMGDVGGAVAYARDVADQDVFQELFEVACRRPALIGPMLEETAGIASPVDLLQRIPPGTVVPGLVGALLHVVTAFLAEASLLGCTLVVIQRERLELTDKYIREASEGVLVGCVKAKGAARQRRRRRQRPGTFGKGRGHWEPEEAQAGSGDQPRASSQSQPQMPSQSRAPGQAQPQSQAQSHSQSQAQSQAQAQAQAQPQARGEVPGQAAAQVQGWTWGDGWGTALGAPGGAHPDALHAQQGRSREAREHGHPAHPWRPAAGWGASLFEDAGGGGEEGDRGLELLLERGRGAAAREEWLCDPWDTGEGGRARGVPGAGGPLALRCSGCLEPVLSSSPAVAFFCAHAFHRECLGPHGGEEGAEGGAGEGAGEGVVVGSDSAVHEGEGGREEPSGTAGARSRARHRQCPVCRKTQQKQLV